MELETLEGVIAREIGSFVAVGSALFTIRDHGLYREGFKTFNIYCTERWGMERTYAHRLINGSQVAANISQAVYKGPHGPCFNTHVKIQPTNEFQVRPLAQLEPEQQCEVWEEAVRSADGKVVTFKLVKALVEERIGPAPPTPPKERDPYAHSDAHALALGVHHPHLPPPGPGAGLPFACPCPDCSHSSGPALVSTMHQPPDAGLSGAAVGSLKDSRPRKATPSLGLLPPCL